jgi:hypothetical protein
VVGLPISPQQGGGKGNDRWTLLLLLRGLKKIHKGQKGDLIVNLPVAVDTNGRFQMQGGKNWILPKLVNANRFFWDSHWLEIWSNHFCTSMGLKGGSVATDSVCTQSKHPIKSLLN